MSSIAASRHRQCLAASGLAFFKIAIFFGFSILYNSWRPSWIFDNIFYAIMLKFGRIMYYSITNNFCSLCISKIFIVFRIFPIFYISWRPSWIFDTTIYPIMLKFGMIMYYSITNNFCSLCISKIFIVFRIFPIFYISWRPSWIFDITIYPIMLKFGMIMYNLKTNNFCSLCKSKLFIVF